ncbi:MAG: hypothetical protein H6622_15085 [Halobacteriovoraceae bacterium]|nr:hypothetical protein [Halobacteriovoraceae bacterium]
MKNFILILLFITIIDIAHSEDQTVGPKKEEEKSKINLDFYASLALRQNSWTTLSGGEGVEIESSIYKTADFTVRSADNWAVGLALDLGDSENKAQKIAANIGLGNWGFIIEQGDIKGKFLTYDRLSYQNTGTFEFDYKKYVIYSGKEFKTGGAYVEWNMPSEAKIEWGTSKTNEITFFTQKTNYKLIGYFMEYDQLRYVMQYPNSSKNNSINFSTSVIIGFMQVEPLEVNNSKILSLTGNNPKFDKEASVGTMSEARLAYIYAAKKEKYTWGLQLGYMARMHGSAMELGDNDMNYTVNPDIELHVSHGPYLRFAMVW